MKIPVDVLIARSYGLRYPWMRKVQRLPGSGLWYVWCVGEHEAANESVYGAVEQT
jgi:hypothetical protein